MERGVMQAAVQIKRNVMEAGKERVLSSVPSSEWTSQRFCLAFGKEIGDFQDLFLQRNKDRDKWQRNGAMS